MITANDFSAAVTLNLKTEDSCVLTAVDLQLMQFESFCIGNFIFANFVSPTMG